MKRKHAMLLHKRGEVYPEYSYEITPKDAMDQVRLEELPLFTFKELANATENFHLANKLGQGGFGPVYKVNFRLLIPAIMLYGTSLMLIYLAFVCRENWRMEKK